MRPFADPAVGYVCGELRYLAADGTNQEGVYWRYETAVRRMESRLGSITAGNGAIYAVRREAYLRLDPRTSHDLSLPVQHRQAGLAGGLRAGARSRVERPLADRSRESSRASAG